MGDGEEVYGLVVYVGNEGYESYEEIIDLFAFRDEIDVVLDQKCLKVEFVNRKEIEDFDKEVYKQLGLKFRGRNQYPLIRRNDPGLFPWPMDDAQAVFLTHCLEQSVNVVQQAIEGIIEISEQGDDELLVMVPEIHDGKDIEWKPAYVESPEPNEMYEFIPNVFLVNRVKRKLKKRDAALFLSFRYIMNPIQENEGERPFFPRLALWVDGDSGFIIANNLYSPGDIWNQFQHDFIEVLDEIGYIPDSIWVNSSMGMDLVELFADELDFELEYDPDHPLFSDLSETFEGFF